MVNDKLINAAEECGFNLEFRTKKILEKLNHHCNINQLIKFNDELIEIDVTAYDGVKHHVIIECKGCSPESYLLAVRDPAINSCTKRVKINDTFRISQFPVFNNNVGAFTGDFLSANFKRISKDDARNNFYKAQEQIDQACIAYASDPAHSLKLKGSSVQFILPLIVTNAKIYIIDYETEPSTLSPCKWFLQRIKNTHSFGDHDLTHYLVPVVNIDYLPELLSHSTGGNEEGSMVLPPGILEQR